MPPPAANVRDLALIGAGSWGRNLARCFEQHGALRAIVETGAEAPALRRLYPHAALTANFGDVLADPAIRKVVIATPSATHFELARAALQAGKDVFVEKPVCLRASDARTLADLAERAGRVLMVGHLLQYHPCVVKLRELVASGALGELLTITSNRLNLGKFRPDENALYSFAPHDVSLVLSLTGDRLPVSVRCVGASYLSPGVADSTTTLLKFDGGVLAQLHVSWLNPFKEQKLTVVGTHGMAVFDDTKPWPEKLVTYRDYIAWTDGVRPSAAPARAEAQPVNEVEPLLSECEHFLLACERGQKPRTDGREGVRVMQVLDMAQRSLELDGERVTRAGTGHDDYSAHPSAIVDDGARVGAGTKIWHFSHVMSGAHIGERCNFGQNVFVAGGVRVGDQVKVQNNVSLYDGVELESGVFVGPSVVFTNVKRPRAELSRQGDYTKTLVRQGATLGANATIVCGVTLGRYCFIAAGAVVTRDVPDHALMIGNPARQRGWVGRTGQRLRTEPDGTLRCCESGERYREVAPGRLVRENEG